jgi:hypothetical protein
MIWGLGIFESVIGNDLQTFGRDRFLRIGNGIYVEGPDHVVTATPGLAL